MIFRSFGPLGFVKGYLYSPIDFLQAPMAQAPGPLEALDLESLVEVFVDTLRKATWGLGFIGLIGFRV